MKKTITKQLLYRRAWLWLVILFLHPALQAHETSDQAISELSLEQLLTVKIASRNEESVDEAPSSVTVITQQQIQVLGVDSLQALLNYVPGFQSSREVEQGTADRISARSRSTAVSESVLVLIDGQRLNDLYSGGISILNRKISLEHIKQVEIIRGPGSALYGSNAFLGTINLITESGENRARLSLGDDGYARVSALLHADSSATSNFDLFTSWFHQAGDNYLVTDSNGIRGDTRDPIGGIDFYLKYQLTDWQINARYMNRDIDKFLTFGSLSDSNNKEHASQWSLSLNRRGNWNDNLTYTYTGAFSRDQWNTRALLIPAGTELAPGVTLENDFVGGPLLESSHRQLYLDHHYQTNGRFTYDFGLHWVRDEIDDVANVTNHNPVTLEYLGEQVEHRGQLNFSEISQRETTSFYGQSQIQLEERWKLTIGARYDRHSDFGHSTNPRLGLVWLASTRHHFKLLYGSAYRAPNFLELYDKNNPVDFGNADLLAEEVETSEFSWHYHSTYFKLVVTWFNNHFNNLIELGPPLTDSNNPFNAPTFMNTQTAETRGREIWLRFKPTEDLSFQLNWNHFSEESIIETAHNSGALILNYEMNSLLLNFNTIFRSHNHHIENQSSYSVSNLNLTYHQSRNLDWKFKIDNLFNKEYRTVSSIFMEGVPNPGRQIRLDAFFFW